MVQCSRQRPKKLLSRQFWLCWRQGETAHSSCRPWHVSGRLCCCQHRREVNMGPELGVHAQEQPPADTSCLPVL